jgi:hypothetical protein
LAAQLGSTAWQHSLAAQLGSTALFFIMITIIIIIIIFIIRLTWILQPPSMTDGSPKSYLASGCQQQKHEQQDRGGN